MTFEFIPEYKLAIDSIKKNKVTFLSGAAGSGKSTFIKYLQSKIKHVILLAPTGIASINIKGQTIHSFFKFPGKFLEEKDINVLPMETKNIIRKCSLLIIDEISMASANIVDAVDISLRKNRGVDFPFGGLHVLFVGDLYQLSPVIKNDAESIFYSEYQTPFFFGSRVINDLIDIDQFNVVKLNAVKRQNDPVFIEALGKIRTNTDAESAIELINSRASYSNKPLDGYIQITPYKDVCDLSNDKMMDEIDSPPKTYFGSVSGTFHESNYPVPQTITLKVGAQVMVCKNLSANIVNGTIGKVVSLHDDYVKIDTPDTKDVIVKTTNWDQYSYVKTDKGYESKITGKFIQIPLKPAWSITIHKIQSTTIEKLYIDMSRGAFSPGMLYVALSRAKSLEGIMLSSPLSPLDVMIDPIVTEFYDIF